MSQSNSAQNPTIAIAQLGVTPESVKFKERHALLESSLRAMGARVIALNGAKDHVSESRFSRYFTFDSDTSGLQGVDETIAVNAARDLSGGIARYTEVRALNPRQIRDIVASKYLQYHVLEQELADHMPRTVQARATREDIEEAIDTFEERQLLLKADKDPDKKHEMLTGTKDEIASDLDEYLEGFKPDENVIVQAYLPEVKSQFAPSLRFVDEADKEKLRTNPRANREYRVHTIDGEPFLAHARVGVGGKDALDYTFVFPEESTVPSPVFSLARRAATLLHLKAGVQDSYVAVDITPDGERIVEINGRNIGEIYPEKGGLLAKKAHATKTNAVAEKLFTMGSEQQKLGRE